MTHALTAAYNDLHPHEPAGSSQGGQFAPAGSSQAQKSKPGGRPASRQQSKPATHHTSKPSGDLGFDGKRGTGYGMKGGDVRVRRMQTALNRLGLTDAAGRRLAVDGKFGPKTTAAVKAAQKRLGIEATGKVTEAFIRKLEVSHRLPKAAHAASSEPYGDVEYADPGYQADGKKRYPLDSEEHCRAAWSYINQSANAAKYSPDELARIKAKIKAAGRRYGIDFADNVKAAAGASAVLRGVELARPGAWKLSTGPTEFTDQMLRDAADFFAASGGQAVPVKLGHVDDRWDGEPAFGSVTNVRYAEDDRGPVLLGDIVDMPEWLSAAAPRRWPNRSIEGWQNFTYDGREYSLVLSGLAFLGVTPPAVRNIRSLADLQTALAASAALRIVASAPDMDVAEAPSTPAPEAEESEEIGAGMNLAKYREALAGLPDDASEDEVEAALSAVGLSTASPPPEPATGQAPAAGQASQSEPERQQPGVAAAAQPGTIVLASSVWEETQKTIKSLTDFVSKTKRNERDAVIAKAVIDGKFTPAQKPHFAKLWDADPDGTRNLINTLMPNSALAVMASGYAGETDEMDNEYAALYRNEKVG